VTVLSAFVSAYWILPPGGVSVTTPSDVAGLILFLSMGTFMSVIAEFYRRTRQRLQEKSIELETANEALRHLSSKLISAQEEERKRVAGDIHDTIGACLTGIKFKVEEAQLQIGKSEGAPVECLNNVVPLIQEGIAECRRIQMDLRPSVLDDLGLLAAISWSCNRSELRKRSISRRRLYQVH
jgi:signal transduction histidine kinase